MNARPLVEVQDLSKSFLLRSPLSWVSNKKTIKAVNNINFTIKKKETLALVGESGCGKSTTGKLLLRLAQPTSGRILFEGKDFANSNSKEMLVIRKKIQIIFQDPYGSLSPRRNILQIIAEPLIAHGLVSNFTDQKEKVSELLKKVGLSPDHMSRYPKEFSGGQRQRIGIARAIAVEPAFIVADEPVSALDVSVQAQIVNLLQELQEEKELSYLFISHDLRVVRHIAHRVAVMYLGEIIEEGPKDQIFNSPHHPYTQALMSAAPEPGTTSDKKRIILKGDVPSPMSIPSGCPFRTRCPLAQNICEIEKPILKEVFPTQYAACHFSKPNPITSFN